MFLKHVALVCCSEDHSDKFYHTVLGLKKTRSRVLPAALTKQIFNVAIDCKFIDYKNENMHFEIFIVEQHASASEKFEHVCLEVLDLKTFLRTCREMDVKILQIPQGEGRVITFISDYDGNLFEIKETS